MNIVITIQPEGRYYADNGTNNTCARMNYWAQSIVVVDVVVVALAVVVAAGNQQIHALLTLRLLHCCFTLIPFNCTNDAAPLAVHHYIYCQARPYMRIFVCFASRGCSYLRPKPTGWASLWWINMRWASEYEASPHLLSGNNGLHPVSKWRENWVRLREVTCDSKWASPFAESSPSKT